MTKAEPPKEIWEVEDTNVNFGYGMVSLAVAAKLKLPHRFEGVVIMFISQGGKRYVVPATGYTDLTEAQLVAQFLGRKCFLKSFFSTPKQDGQKVPASGRRKVTP